MPDDDAATAPVPTVSLLGGGLKGTPAPPRLFPGDLVCFRAAKPYEWLPWYGIILSPNNQMVKYFRNQNKQKSMTWDSKSTSLGAAPTASTLPAAVSLSSTLPGGAKEPPGVEIPEDVSLTNDEEEEEEESVVPITDEGLSDPVYVLWTHTQRVAIVPRSELAIVDRSLLRGQRVKNEDGIEGTVFNTVNKATLQVLNTNHVIDDVTVQDMNPISPFVHGREIQYKGWIGVITKVKRHVTCRLDNGGFVFSLKSNEADSFMKKDPFWGLGMPCPGMRNKFSPPVMKRAAFVAPMMRFIHRWVRPLSYFYTRSSATTIGVETSSIQVLWIQRCPNCPTASESEPPAELEKEVLREVRTLGLPNHETFGLNSIRMYGIQEGDALTNYSSWYSGFQAKFFGGPSTSFAKFLLTPSSINNLLAESGYEVPVKVIFRQTEVEVEWDNGISEHMLGSRVPRLLLPSNPASEYQTGFIVADPGGQVRKYGVIVCQDSEPGKVRVHWIVGLDKEEDTVDLGVTKCDLADLKPHPLVSMCHRGLTIFLKDHPLGYESGTVVDIELRLAKLLVAVPESRDLISVYPHLMAPVAKRCYWNFHTRNWVQESVDLPSGKVPKAKDIYDDEGEVDDELIEMEEDAEPAENEVVAVGKQEELEKDLEDLEDLEKKRLKVPEKEVVAVGNWEELPGTVEVSIEKKVEPEVVVVGVAIGKENVPGCDAASGNEEKANEVPSGELAGEESKASIDASEGSQADTGASSPASSGSSESGSASHLRQEEKEEEIIPVGEIKVDN